MKANGILEHVPGPFVSQGRQALPAVETAEDRDYAVEIDAGHVGLVRLFFRKQKAKRGKFSHWFWVAVRAEHV